MAKKFKANLKDTITLFVMKELEISLEHEKFQKCYRVWWQNPRNKEKGGLKLTEAGYNSFKKADIKEYRIILEKSKEVFCNKHVIWLDSFIECPWYIDGDYVCIFGEKMAVELALFQGNLIRYANAKVRNAAYT